MEVYANPEGKPSGFLEINNSHFIDGESYIVDRIADHGFEFCDALTEMQTGPDCWLIGKNAFYGCTKLKKFTEYTPGSIESKFYALTTLISKRRWNISPLTASG